MAVGRSWQQKLDSTIVQMRISELAKGNIQQPAARNQHRLGTYKINFCSELTRSSYRAECFSKTVRVQAFMASPFLPWHRDFSSDVFIGFLTELDPTVTIATGKKKLCLLSEKHSCVEVWSRMQRWLKLNTEPSETQTHPQHP